MPGLRARATLRAPSEPGTPVLPGTPLLAPGGRGGVGDAGYSSRARSPRYSLVFLHFPRSRQAVCPKRGSNGKLYKYFKWWKQEVE